MTKPDTTLAPTNVEVQMSGDPLYVQPDGVRSYAQIHDEVVAGLSQLMGAAAPEAAGAQTSHGVIASAVSTALSTVLGSRQGTMQTTSTSGATISELLQKAAQMYEQGDQKGAATLRAAAEALKGANAAGTSGNPGGGGSSAQAAATEWARCSARLAKLDNKSARWPRRRVLRRRPLLSRYSNCPNRSCKVSNRLSRRASRPRRPSMQRMPVRPIRLRLNRLARRGRAGTANAGRAPEPPRPERAQPARTPPQAD